MRTMTTAERFFWKHAGTSWDPKTETRAQGRRRGAEELAAAEAWAVDQLAYTWEYDGMRADCTGDVFGCVARWRDGSVAASLWGICDPGDDYSRVVEAELASEARDEAMSALLAGL